MLPLSAQALQKLETIHRVADVSLDTFTSIPLENRTPLILIHGINAEKEEYYHWAPFLNYARRDDEFQRRFKIYLLRYDTSKDLPLLSENLAVLLDQFSNLHPGVRYKVLAYSEGGLLYRNVMHNPEINAQTDAVLTIGTPFHGSPLAHPSWMREQFKNGHPMNPVRMTSGLVYWVTEKKFPGFEKDFHWDNFDCSLCNNPNITVFPKAEQDYKAFQHKFITYGSFFGSTDNSTKYLLTRLANSRSLPKERHQARHLFSKHFIFSLVENNISKLPVVRRAFKNPPDDREKLTAASASMNALPEQPDSNSAPLMLYNDGISPISSSLWLGRFSDGLALEDDPMNKLWGTLVALKNNTSARLFPSLDHIDLIDGTTRTRSQEVPDLLNPNESPRPIFEWILNDLKRQ